MEPLSHMVVLLTAVLTSGSALVHEGTEVPTTSTDIAYSGCEAVPVKTHKFNSSINAPVKKPEAEIMQATQAGDIGHSFPFQQVHQSEGLACE